MFVSNNILKNIKKRLRNQKVGLSRLRVVYMSQSYVGMPRKNVKTRVGYKKIKDGIKKRFAKVSGATF